MQTLTEKQGQELANKEFAQFQDMSDDRFDVYQADRFIKESAQENDKPYIIHTAWAARILARTRPVKHIDISSFLYFNTIVSAFVPIEFYDYRPLDLSMPGLTCNHADLTDLQIADNSIRSLSCMHTVEHIGLGRYGDPLDPGGDLKAIKELKRVLAGDLLFVVPVGKPMVVFNLHRVYSYEQIMEYFDGLELVDFGLVPDETPGDFILGATAELVSKQVCGCGCFWFRKE